MATITGTFEALAATVLDAVKKTINLVETPTGTLANQQGDADGNAYVVFPSGATVPLSSGPETHTAITKSDDTDTTAIANVGVYVGGAGDLAYRTAGDPTTTVTLTVVAGQFVWGQLTRVMAATTATNIVGVAR